jgi:nitroreductase
MDAFNCLMDRQSIPPGQLGEPVPDDGELGEILATAMRAPDHGALRPWRFAVIRGAAREALGELYADVAARANPDASSLDIDKARGKPLRAPLILAVWAQVVENHPKVPAVEQVVATAMAAQNVLNALYARGYGGILLTGAPAHDPVVRAALGLAAKDELVGFIYAGTPANATPVKVRPDVAAHVSEWTGPASGASQAAE